MKTRILLIGAAFLLALVAGFYLLRAAQPQHSPALAQPCPSLAAAPAARPPNPAERRAWRRRFSAVAREWRTNFAADGLVLEAQTAAPAARRAWAGTPAFHGARSSSTSRQTFPFLVRFAGPVTPEWKREVTEIGGHLRGYVPHNAYLVELTESGRARLAHASFIRSIAEYEPADKLAPFLQQLVMRTNSGGPAVWPLSIVTLAPDDAPGVAQWVRDQGGGVLDVVRGRRNGLVRAQLDLAALADLARRGEVQWVEEYVAPRLVNDYAVQGRHLNATSVWAVGRLTGAGQIVGHADTGLDIGSLDGIHPDFAGRVRAALALGRPGDWSDTHSHGTHTAGSILGNGAASDGQFRGVAWEAELVHQSVMDAGGGLGGLPADLNDLFAQAYELGARVHSDSWGSSVYGSYTADSRQCDEFMWDHPDMLLVFSAGNDGTDGSGNGVVDPGSIGSPATAKNVLSVGAAESDREPGSGGYTAKTYGEAWPWDYPAAPLYDDFISQSSDGAHQGISAFSSRGPCTDGRVKPDVVAPGTDIVSVRSRATSDTGWGPHPNTNYCFMGGTSMACPLSAGAAALARQYCTNVAGLAQPSAALVKALLVNGARSLTPGQFGTNAWREIPPPPRPNDVEGWGEVNLADTLFPPAPRSLLLHDGDPALETGHTNTHRLYVYGDTPLRITLAYTDYPATAGSGLNLVNDLDLVLVGPDGVPHHPGAGSGPDRLNNAEGVDLDSPAAGVYEVRIGGPNVPEGPQPYALVISGGFDVMPVIAHTPLDNTTNTVAPYVVEAQITSLRPLTNNAWIAWNTTGTTDLVTQAAMTWVTNTLYRGTIPPHANPTKISYYLVASSGGPETRDPSNAPAAWHHFAVTGPLTLTVTGTPSALYHVSPDYGVNLLASGIWVRANAPHHVMEGSDARAAIAGWRGTGSAPAAGDFTQAEFRLEQPSSLDWQWAAEYALIQTSTVAGLLDTTTWWRVLTAAQTVTAPATVSRSGTTYAFAGWYLDGARQPDDGQVAINPVRHVLMLFGRRAGALYLPADEDRDGNGLADWWEYYYFGTTGIAHNADSDDDGFTNRKEFLDRTNPRDAADTPTPPGIAHFPLSDPQVVPAPWPVAAAVTDNWTVADVRLFWSRNGGDWLCATLLPREATGWYTNALPAPGVDGDRFTYRIEARDAAGLAAQNGPYALAVHYPLIDCTPAAPDPFLLPAGTVTQFVLRITNSGSGTLEWTAQADNDGLLGDAECGPGNWTHAGANDLWHLTTQRQFSATHAWHCGSDVTRQYLDNTDAALVMPPLVPGANARLMFRQWAWMEYDNDQQDNHYWDGGIVELSTNRGATFEQIEPVGGYPYRITANPASPFTPETPCLAGDGLGWEEVAFDLAAYAGQEVQLRFRFGSDGYVVREGWYLDDFTVGPLAMSNDWLSLEAPGGHIAPLAASGLVVRCATAPLAPTATRRGWVCVRHNDPVRGQPYAIPITLHNLSRAIVVTTTPLGTATPTGTVLVADGADATWTLAADPYCRVAGLLTNGTPVELAPRVRQTNFVWLAVRSNGTLAIEFDAVFYVHGTPEWWLALHHLTNADGNAEAEDDPDTDGMRTWQEYVAQTEPTNAASVALVLTGAQPAGGDGTSTARCVVTWLSFTNTGYTYDLERAADPREGFVTLEAGLPATPPVNIHTDAPAAPPAAVYRVRVLRP